MWNNFLKFIKELQESDDGRKRRWLIIFTIPAMVLVLAVWGFMIQTNFSTSQSVSDEEDFSTQFLALFHERAVRFSDQFGRGISRLGALVSANLWDTTTISPKPAEKIDFVLDSLEPIEPQKIHGN